MNPHEWLADFIKDMNGLHTAMIGVGVLITGVCFKAYVPEFAKDTELAVKGWIRLVIAAGLVVGFGSFAEITGEAFDGLANYINPKWQTGNTEFYDVYQKIMAMKKSNDPANPVIQKRSLNPLANWTRDVADNVYAALIMAFMTILTWLALAVMFFLEVVHTVLLNAEYALIPAFLGFLANPSTAHLGHGFLVSFLGLQMWIPVCSLVTKVNDSLIRGAFAGLYTGQAPTFEALGNFSAAGAAAPLLGSLALFGFFALWIIFTIRAVPTIADKLVRGEGFAPGFSEGGWKAVEAAKGYGATAFKGGAKAAIGVLDSLEGSPPSKGKGHASGSGSASHGHAGGGEPEPTGSSPLPIPPPPEISPKGGGSGRSRKSPTTPRRKRSPAPKPMSDAANPYSDQNRKEYLDKHLAEISAALKPRILT